jgi:hypothetical protein
MFYDVNVSRISTATLPLRIEADSPEEAAAKACEMAGDVDFGGCVVDYDFEASGVTEARDRDTTAIA